MYFIVGKLHHRNLLCLSFNFYARKMIYFLVFKVGLPRSLFVSILFFLNTNFTATNSDRRSRMRAILTTWLPPRPIYFSSTIISYRVSGHWHIVRWAIMETTYGDSARDLSSLVSVCSYDCAGIFDPAYHHF